MNNSYHIYGKNAGDGVSKLVEVEHSMFDNTITIKPTETGSKFFKNLLPAGEEIDLDSVSDNQMGILFGVSNFSGTIQEFADQAQVSGSFVVTSDQEYNPEVGNFIDNSHVINGPAEKYGSSLFSKKGMSTHSIILGDINGAKEADITTSPTGQNQKDENRRLAISYAMNKAMGNDALLSLDSNTGSMVLMTNIQESKGRFMRSDLGITSKKEHLAGPNRFSISDLKSIETGKDFNDGFGESFKSAYKLMKATTREFREDFVKSACLNALCGGVRAGGSSIQFETTINDNGQVNLRAMPITDISPDLMFDPGHSELNDSVFTGKSPSDLTLQDVLTEFPHFGAVLRAEPDLLASAFNAAKEAQAEISNIIKNDVEAQFPQLKGLSDTFGRYTSNPITPGAEINLLNSYEISPEDEHPDAFLKRVMGDDSAYTA